MLFMYNTVMFRTRIMKKLLFQVLPDLLVGDLPVSIRHVDGLLDSHGPLPDQNLETML
jgi:hypothetical protein